MACRDAFEKNNYNQKTTVGSDTISKFVNPQTPQRLRFGVDSNYPAFDLLQNNIDLFSWVVRNKIYPDYWGRNMTGDNCLTREEIEFLHDKGCKVAAIYQSSDEKLTEEQGIIFAKKIDFKAFELGIPAGSAIFLEISENEMVKREFMSGFAKTLMIEGYTPAFKVNTDAKCVFDQEFSRGMQNEKEIFENCLIWATAPTVKEYDGMTTTHLIHPDAWQPFAPSCIRKKDIAVWQYGVNCHPIEDNDEKTVTFNLDLVRHDSVIIQKMF